ncbi:uncharacterized protein [Eucyclogobius newberryi]|uniref:uncharacterized protein n=1 Tax=Eucyclogobius newberryi TaxID=166745 RepID=UPI003B59917E
MGPDVSILPEYHHTVCSCEILQDGGFKASIKLKISLEEEIHQWLEAFQDSSKTTWRVLKTYPTTPETNRNKYRVRECFGKCHQKRRNSSSSKNTLCPAVLYLVLKKETFSQNRKSRSIDPHIKNQLAFHINIRNTHNHECSEALQHRNVSKETVDKLVELFKMGHSPSSALKILKYNLQQELGERYARASADRSVCPDLHFCFRLYYKMFKRKCKAKGPSDEMQISSTQNPLDHSFAIANQEQCPDLSSDQGPSTQERNDLEIRLWNMFKDLMEKCNSNNTFLEPIKEMVSSYEKMNTNGKIISALHRFGRTRCTISVANQLKIRARKCLATDRCSSPLDTAQRKAKSV